MLVDEQALVSYLRDESIVSILDAEREDATSRPTTRPAMRRMAFQQIAAAMVVGVIVGLLGAGVVWAVNSPQSQIRTLHIVNGDFETMSGPVEGGFPSYFGMWGGNPAEVIEGSDGSRMLRFLKTGNVNGDPDDPGLELLCLSVGGSVDSSAAVEYSRSRFTGHAQPHSPLPPRGSSY
jgi:hypothetical protein